MEIPAAARVCHICSGHQNRRWDLFWKLGLGAVIVPPLAAALFAAGKDLYVKATWKDDLQVVSFYSDVYYTLRNGGSGPVFVSDIRTRWEHHEDIRMSVNRTVDPGQFLAMAHKQDGFQAVVRNVSPDDQQAIGKLNLPGECLKFAYVFAGDPALEMYRANLLSSLRTVSTKATVRYYSKKGTPLEREFPVEVILTRRDTTECALK